MTSIPEDAPVFSISVVARMVGIHQQTIRSYEKIGLVSPARSQGNTRLYSPADVDRLRQVVRLSTELGINLAGIEVILRLGNQIEQLREELKEKERALHEAQRHIERLQAGRGNGSRDGG